MKLKRISKVESGQDIVIFGKYLFDFVAHGKCIGEVSVYELSTLHASGGEEPDPICRFILDKADIISPHANAVCFGTEYYEDGDEFPLLYANVYNNFAKCEDRHEGECLVYRIMREGNSFKSTLVQMIKIGFVEDREMWKSTEGNEDIRPYGNFIIDRDSNVLYAFVMRDKPFNTRYFSFDVPKVREGEYNSEYGIPVRTLALSEVKDYFDTDYHRSIQGACVHNGIIYSVEGGTRGEHVPGIRVVLPDKKRLSLYACFSDMGVCLEPEGIDFVGDVCYYVAGHGDTYIIEF